MAKKHIPEKPELLIGILDSKPGANVPVNVIPSELRVNYLTYVFDDVDGKYEDYVLINRKTAERILTDFSKVKNSIESLAVHCKEGLGRSPAVAAALNDCFSLGHEPEEFFEQFYALNREVYDVIVKAGLRMGFCARG